MGCASTPASAGSSWSAKRVDRPARGKWTPRSGHAWTMDHRPWTMDCPHQRALRRLWTAKRVDSKACGPPSKGQVDSAQRTHMDYGLSTMDHGLPDKSSPTYL